MTPERMAEIHEAAFQTQRPWSAEEFTELLNSDNTVQFTETGACFALGRIIADEAELLTIATMPDQRRKGLARACLQSLIFHCRSAGCNRLFLEVDADNAAAISLYLSLGFTESGRRKNYYRYPNGNRGDALLLSLPLKS